MNIFAARLINLRKGKGLTQDELADALHTSHSTISMIESGAREPSKEIAKKLSDFFQVPIELFLYKQDIQSPAEPKKTVNSAQILLIADIVQEFLQSKGYEITPEQRALLVDHFYQQNITDANKIRESLSVLGAMLSTSKRAS